ncbi:MAG: hypothetical protein U0667_10575 [Chloroflexota bacterium]
MRGPVVVALILRYGTPAERRAPELPFRLVPRTEVTHGLANRYRQ